LYAAVENWNCRNANLAERSLPTSRDSGMPSRQLDRPLRILNAHRRRFAVEGWWKYQQHNCGVCLDNVPVVGKQGGEIALFDQSQADEPDGSIVPETGIYVPGLGVRAQINWGNQVTTELLKEV
jgi:hypothetical protein